MGIVGGEREVGGDEEEMKETACERRVKRERVKDEGRSK